MGCCCVDDDNKTGLKPRISKGRSCTDCFCFLIFIVFISGMSIITLLTIFRDNGLQRLRYGFDSYLNVCGQKNELNLNQTQFADWDTTGLNYVLFFDYTKPIKSLKACVKHCPDEHIDSLDEFKNYTLRKNATLCFYSVKPGDYNPSLCPVIPIFKSIQIANRCIPMLDEVLKSKIKLKGIETFIQSDLYKLSFIQLYQQLPMIGLLSLGSLILTVFLVFLLRYISRAMVIIVFLVSSLGCIALSTFLWLEFVKLNNQAPIAYIFPLIGVETDAKTAYLVYSILATILTLILLLVVFVMRKRIGLVVKLFAEAQKALSDMPMLFILPVFTFVILFMFITYWLLTAFGIYQFGEETSSLFINNIEINRKILTNVMWVYHVVALIWISEFIFGCQSMMIVSSVAKWYFTRQKSALKSPICLSLKRLIVFHMGSVALGSFLITLIRFPRWCLMYFQDKIKASRSSVAEFCAKACICCLWCLEKFMLFINYNAYTIIAIEGLSFCSAAQKAFVIIVENSLRIATINSVGDFLLFLSKLAVTAITLIVAVFALDVPISDLEQLKFRILPLVLVAIISFLIAHTFFTIYEMVIDALMVCFCEDCRANDGSEERPYYMHNSLKQFVDESSTHITINN